MDTRIEFEACDGEVRELRSRILHDDRKSHYDVGWIHRVNYAELEAKKLMASTPENVESQ